LKRAETRTKPGGNVGDGGGKRHWDLEHIFRRLGGWGNHRIRRKTSQKPTNKELAKRVIIQF